MPEDPAVRAHKEWLGYVQPAGLVVSIPALLEASAFINRNFGPEHARFLEALPVEDGAPVPEIRNLPEFARAVFDWNLTDLYGSAEAPPIPDSLDAVLENYDEVLRPTYALREYQPKDSSCEWILLVQVLPHSANLDEVAVSEARHWQASPQARFERLLRQVHVPIGLLVNGTQIRLVYAPEKELSGHLTFNLRDMVQVAGRPLLAALQMLLSSERLYSASEKDRLPAILANSRKYQNVVSTQLAGQVLEALYEMLRGFQAADDATNGELLRQVLARDPNHVYAGLLTTLLRLVFLLYAEDRGLVSTDPVYSNYYSVTGLYERLRADAGRHPDTMNQRYGAWAQLLALFQLIYSGGRHAGMRIPAREGYLFDPDRYLFLEGRQKRRDDPQIPRVADGVVHKVLEKLLILGGERLSYRTLAVEQIGSVYEAIMGFELQVAGGQSIAIKAAKKHGAPATINLEALLQVAPDKRLKCFAEVTDQKLTGTAGEELKSAAHLNDLLAALEKKIAKTVTPNVVPKGAMIFQPSNERRKSGSHYTPSTLTGPIVEAALAPVLKQLGDKPRPEQILNLKVCDPAMGSGAFLVESCRQLGAALSKAWHAHGEVPLLPPDEDEDLHAQRIVAQRCLYGVDMNPLAADLAKLSLWLATLAKDHPFTFLDHSLRHGDSLVGLTRKQIAAIHWLPAEQQTFLDEQIRKRIDKVSAFRQRILAARDDRPYAQLRQELDGAEESLSLPRIVGDATLGAFFSADKPKAREDARRQLRDQLESDLREHGYVPAEGAIDTSVAGLHRGHKGIVPFHWELEFPEVFAINAEGKVGGFDMIVGNPPFAGKNTLIDAHRNGYIDWLKAIHEHSHGNSDLVAHFFRRAFELLRPMGCFGLIATNSIGQGDTRSTGLCWICTHGGTIYRARKRLRWPGQAAVVVSVVHVAKGVMKPPYSLDGREVPAITAYLFHAGGHDDPAALPANAGKSFIGVYLLGMGFTFDDNDKKGAASPIMEMERLIQQNCRNSERIFPYIGGEEINDDPTHACSRYVINFEDWPLRRIDLGRTWATAADDTRKEWLRDGIVPLDYPYPVAADFPDLLAIVEKRVKPERIAQKDEYGQRFWWRFLRTRPEMQRALKGLPRFIVLSRIGNALAFTFLSAGIIPNEKTVVFPFADFATFGVLQSRVHEIWARFFSTTLKDDLSYAPSLSFEPFPFPQPLESDARLAAAGLACYEHRAELMRQRDAGLTTVANWFNDPDTEDPDIQRLRKLCDALDRAVLDAYGWTEIQPQCRFMPEFDDEEDEDDNGRPRNKKYRYRWPDEVRDEVLAQLLDLNRQRTAEEGQPTSDSPRPINGKNGGRKKKGGKQIGMKGAPTLFAAQEGEA
jgi:hypothetical protein